MAILRDKVIIRQCENQVLVGVARVKWQDLETFPLLVEYMQALGATILQPKARKLGVVIKVQKRTVLRRGDARDESTRGGGGCDGEEVLRADVGGGREIEDIDLPVLGLGDAVVVVSRVFQRQVNRF